MRRSFAGMLAATLAVFGLTVVAPRVSAGGPYTISVSNATVPESAGQAHFAFQVSPPVAAGDKVTVNWCTTDGTAKSGQATGNDYVGEPNGGGGPHPVDQGCAGVVANALIPRTETFCNSADLTCTGNSRANPQTESVSIIDDSTPEQTETFSITMMMPACTGACTTPTLGNGGLGAILDNDCCGLSINDVSGSEGNSGTSPFTFTISSNLPVPAECKISVPFTTTDGSAASPTDYQTRNDTAVIPGSGLATTVAVNVNGDTTNEPDETFNVNLGVPTASSGGANKACDPPTVIVTDANGLGTIKNDDGPTPSSTPTPTGTGSTVVNIGDGTPEPATKFSDCTFVVSRSGNTVGTSTVDFATNASGDMIDSETGTLVFSPGETSETIVVDVRKQKRHNESFTVQLSNPVNTLIGDGTGRCVVRHRRR